MNYQSVFVSTGECKALEEDTAVIQITVDYKGKKIVHFDYREFDSVREIKALIQRMVELQ